MKQNETNNLRKVIVTEIGESYLSPNEISYKEKSKFVQQGHERERESYSNSTR